jgi:hypothetical protein
MGSDESGLAIGEWRYFLIINTGKKEEQIISVGEAILHMKKNESKETRNFCFRNNQLICLKILHRTSRKLERGWRGFCELCG